MITGVRKIASATNLAATVSPRRQAATSGGEPNHGSEMVDQADERRYEMHLEEGKGVLVGDHGQMTNVFQLFTQAPAALASHIRTSEFQTLIDERTRGFIGREFVFEAIEGLLQQSRTFPSGYIVLRGEPGIGKTACLCAFLKRHPAVHHFNVVAQNIRTTRDFLANICAQLIVRYALPHESLPPHAVTDSGFLSRLLSEAAAVEPDKPLVVVVDALDEAEDVTAPNAANPLYLPAVLPPRVYFLVSTREQADDQLSVDRREDIYLRDGDPQNLCDIRQYISAFITEHRDKLADRISDWGVTEDDFIATLTERSQGNFMYLVYVLRDIVDGKLNAEQIGEVKQLPLGLRAYYQRHWRQMEAAGGDRFTALQKPVICTLAAVREPVTTRQLHQWTGIKLASIQSILAEWRPFLNEEHSADGELRYRVYHASFEDFLIATVSLTDEHRQIAETTLAKLPGFKAGRSASC